MKFICLYWVGLKIHLGFPPAPYRASLMAQVVKNLPSMQTQVRLLGWRDPLEKEMATHPNILAWRIPWAEEPGGLQSTGLQSQTQLSY